ncbi:ABC transporter permease subunit [Bradyrhizobium sp. Arg816]|uniref:ABC transporter permease subunit n=1 Tax=Bradyrhizobium sp. Arg816 TaxID=2998491 RepID=UPI00249F43D0|nr:ABC transporter permease subunit [Bradyrhizobium sp. Arg816]MDI3567470.1 ABC transporter permease subunit [Bradyrhizobium sp. Arg816]
MFCHAGFAAESIRSGIQSVDRGQWDAARSLGLRWWPTMRKIVLPQALRVIIPPLTSNFLSLTKSSSLAVAIGYPDLMRVSTVAISDTGRAVECVVTMLLVYLSLSLLTSLFMNWYNGRVTFQRGLLA